MKSTQSYKHRILLTVAGGSPAIVTETLYALTQTTDKPFIPTEIHIITTNGSYQNIKDTLLGENGKVQQLCKDYSIKPPLFPKENIHLIKDKHGNPPLNDITSETDNEITADFITAKVRQLTAEEDTSLHVSIAGGRKTMTYYLGYAMSVFGRIQDTMSHVLVEDQYLSKDFYYPTPKPHLLETRNGTSFDAKNVTIMLGYLPYIRLRDGLTDDLLNDANKSYSEIIEIAQRQLTPMSITLKEGKLHCATLPIELPPVDQAFYCWLLHRHQQRQGNLSFKEKETQQQNTLDFLAFYKIFSKKSEHWHKLKDETFKTNSEENTYTYPMDAKYATERRSKINIALEAKLGKPAATHYLVESSGKRGSKHYGLSSQLKPEHIHIKFD